METSFFLFLPSALVQTLIDTPGNGTQAFFMARARTFMTTVADTKANGETVRDMVMGLTPGQMGISGLDTLGTIVSREKRD
jgi:hypothetical protein